MFNRDNASRTRRGKFAGTTLLALIAPLAATSGLSGGSIEAPDAPSAPSVSDKEKNYPAGTYQLRCWLHGRPLFEQIHVGSPVDASRKGEKIAGSDRNGEPGLVTDTSNATCLMHTPVEESSSARKTP